MPGVKRSRDGNEKQQNGDKDTESTSPFMPMFEIFRNELDEHHDRRERIIKASRDITATSKKIIFALQRVRTLKSDIPPKIQKDTSERTTIIQINLNAIAPDLTGISAWRYQRQISGGIQEYMEAISFEHYLRTQKIITREEAAATMPKDIELTGDDYVLGLFDLIGELMRFAITTMATSGSLPSSQIDNGEKRDVLQDLRQIRSLFEGLDTSSCGGTGLGKDVEKKMEVMKTCVEKVETAVYGMIIRGRERPKGWVPDMGGGDDRGAVESY